MTGYGAVLGDFSRTVEHSFREMHWELGPAWLRPTLAAIELDLGPLDEPHLRSGLAMALRRIARAFAAERAGGKPIGMIRPYCAAIVRKSLEEAIDQAEHSTLEETWKPS